MGKREDDMAKIGEKMFHSSDYDDESELSQALAVTHEQVSDTYTAGSSDGVVYRENKQMEVNPRGKEGHAPK